ncbi:tyrosine-type recombinase/integrase [Actinosynnema mirum]|uniref:Integrase family protein n=1 Tax=Actinosynnema mirum (strain ATCC 29888 / DSM 43827 / JCM 3225 / NBRC 14064 / NCIMB 13271 / NRRL B-12336 / IMRU 3971 / 101) TaxID=446462 RepID=C6WBK0_ACTMD|nr:site-specific integrase [Actinosynnema mirum]ACU35568.1 integrase family protein [Actinosynnema mirum DSM 43827]
MPPERLPRPTAAQWSTWLDDWDRSLRAKNHPRTTRYNYQLAVTQLADYLLHELALDFDTRPPNTAEAAKDPIAVRRPHVEAFVIWMTDTRSAASAKSKFKALQQFFNYIAEEEELDHHPMAKMRQPKVDEKQRRVIPDEQIAAFLAALEGKDYRSRRDFALVRLYFETGGRLAEVVNAGLGDLDLKLDVLHVRGKGGKHRSLPFAAKTGQAVTRYLRARERHLAGRESAALWLPENLPKGAPTPLTVSAVKSMFRRRADAVGPRIHAHLFRHTFSHNWLRNGGSETDLMRLMGWSTRAMLQVYGASAADERAIQAHQKMAMGDRL